MMSALGEAKAKHLATKKPEQTNKPSGPVKLITRRASDIETKPVFWLWRGRVPFGMLAILDGDPGLGKSGITIDLAARLSRGWTMPGDEDEQAPTQSASLFLCGEDSPEHSIKPRLQAAGADLNRVHLIDEVEIEGKVRPITLPNDLAFIESRILELGAKLFIIDPIMGFLGQRTDTNSDSSSREVLSALKMVAERTGAAVIILRHLNKKNGESAMYRGGGSIAFTAAARSALLVGNHPTDNNMRVLATVKLNIGRKPKAITYTVESKDGQPVIRWGDECDLTADDIATRATQRPGEARAEAEEFLQSELAKGPVKAKELEAKARERGISMATLRRAGKEIGAESQKFNFTGDSYWGWHIPGKEKAEGAQEIPP